MQEIQTASAERFAMPKTNLPSERSPSHDIDAFLTKAASVPALSQVKGRLIFAIDATASREAKWTLARDLQAEMFRETAPIGKLDVQLVYYRGDECRASKWVSSGEQLAQLMNKISCEAGHTQIGRTLRHFCRGSHAPSWMIVRPPAHGASL